MAGQKMATAVPSFPIGTIRAAIAAMLLVLCAATYLTYKIGHDVRRVMRSQVDVLTAAERIEHYGAILELSIRAVVANGDMAAALRYKTVQPRLRATIDALQQDLQLKENKVTAARVEQADVALVAMEQEALELAGAGNLAAARSIVDSARYNHLLDLYFTGINQIRRRAEAYVDATDRKLDRFMYVDLALTLAAFGLIVLGWAALVRPAREWGRELDRARENAEHSARQLEASRSELVILNEKLFEQARIDELTNLATRRKFYEDVEQLWSRAERYAERYCAVMCDIDSFKQFNDTYGHLEGDSVLRRVADALASACRGGDRVYRMGGEEFVILLSHCSLEEGFFAADRYRLAVEELNIGHSKSSFSIVTVSMGVAPLDPIADRSVEGWLARADAALYEAKRSGRNRVAAAT